MFPCVVKQDPLGL